MTNEEAVRVLNTCIAATHIKGLPMGPTEDVREALAMGAEALSNPDEDCISRKKAIEALWDGTNMDIYTREVKETLESLPSIQAKTVCIAKINFDKDELQRIVNNAMPVIIESVGPKSGHWINGFCSNCGIYNTSEYKKYCPNCGNKMETNEQSLAFAGQEPCRAQHRKELLWQTKEQ